MPKLGAWHKGFGESRKKKTIPSLFKNKKDRLKFSKRNMDDVLDEFFKSTTYRNRHR